MNTVKKFFRDFAEFAALEILCGIIKFETVVFRCTGCELAALRRYRTEKGRKLQKRLNNEHGTAIEYGIYKY